MYFLCHINSRSPSRLLEDSTPDVVDGKSAQTTPRSVPLPSSKSAGSSRRGSALLPSQQSCEVDDDALTNESSLMTELMQVQQLSVSLSGQSRCVYNKVTGISMTKHALGQKPCSSIAYGRAH